MTYIEEVAAQIKAEVPASLLPHGDTDLLFLFYAVLALTKGVGVGPEDVHDAWSAWMAARGANHESTVKYAELPSSTKAEDEPYVRAIRRIAEQLGKRPR